MVFPIDLEDTVLDFRGFFIYVLYYMIKISISFPIAVDKVVFILRGKYLDSQLLF